MAAILDLGDLCVVGIMKINFDSFFGLVIPENMGLGTKFESLSCFIVKLQHIYSFPIMAAKGSHIGFGGFLCRGDYES